MAVSASQLQQLYLAYFGRPADFAGVSYYTTGDWDIWQVARAFGESPESQALYGTVFGESFVQSVYHNIFGRDAEPAGLLYWTQQVSSGVLAPGEVALAILLGAQNEDATAVANKLSIATTFTAHVDTAQELQAYSGDRAAAIARDFLETVLADSATVPTAMTMVDPTIASIVGTDTGTGGGPGGTGGGGGGSSGSGVTNINATGILTTNQDAFNALKSTVTVVSGFVDNDGVTNNSTLTAGDNIRGNGATTVQLTLNNFAGGIPVMTMSNIGSLDVIAQATGTATVDASGWTNVSEVALSGVDGIALRLQGLDNDAALTLGIAADTAGRILLSGDANTVANLVVTGSLVNATNDATGASASVGLAGIGVDLGAGDTAVLEIGQSSYVQGGNAAVGNMSLGGITAGGIGGLSINAGNYASASISGDASTGNVTIGDIALSGTGATSTQSADIYNRASTTQGNTTVGDIAVGDVDMRNAYSGKLSIRNQASSGLTGAATAGSVTVGDVLMVAEGTAGANTFFVDNNAYAIGGASDNASVGDTTIGDITLTQSGGSNLFRIRNEIHDSGAGGATATAGDIAIGNVTMNALDNGGTNEFRLSNDAFSNVGDASIGDLVIGNIVINGTGAGQTGTESRFVVANYAWYSSSGSTTAGSTSIGNISAFVGDAAVVEINVSAGASSDAGSMSVGNIAMSGGVGSELKAIFSNGSGSDSLSVGDVGVSTDTSSGTAQFFVFCRDGAVNVGDLSVSGNQVWAMVQNDAWIGAPMITTNVGDVSLLGSNVSGQVNLILNRNYLAGAAVGELNVGDVALQTIPGSDLDLVIRNYSDTGAAAAVTLGNIDLTLADSDSTTGAGAQAYLLVECNGNSVDGDVAVGDITVGTSGITTAAAMQFATEANVRLLSLSGTISTGKITVSGGIAGATATNTDNLANLSAWFYAQGTSVTIGDVDYSAYLQDATINVSAYAGAGLIQGGQGANVIVDNAGTNAIDLSAGMGKSDVVYLLNAQDGVIDTGNAGDGDGIITADQLSLDSITGWGSGDSLTLWNRVGNAADAIDGTTNIHYSGAGITYAQFLQNAEAAITNDNDSAYVATIGGSTYVAINNAGKVAEIVEIVGASHTFTWSAGTLVFAS